MELGSQIKKYRNELSLSQDALAEKLYVSRQTISNWENDKSYPDVKSLLLLRLLRTLSQYLLLSFSPTSIARTSFFQVLSVQHQ